MKLLNKTKAVLLRFLLILGVVLFVPMAGGIVPLSAGASAASAQINATEVTLYGLDSTWESYISIPDDYAQSFPLSVTGAKNVSYRVTSGSSVTVSDSGLIEPLYETWYWVGNMGSTDPSWADSASTIEKRAEYGTSQITVTADGVAFVVTVHLIDYADVYANMVMDNYLEKNITDAMTDYEKFCKICEFIAGYPYSPYYQSYIGMIVTGEGGDCWASANTAVKMCQKLGYTAWTRNANKEPGAASGHRNAIAQVGNQYYILDAGAPGSVPRGYYVNVRTSPFAYRQVSGGIEVYQYDTREDVTGSFAVPETIDGYTVVSIGEYFANGSDLSQVEAIGLPDTVTGIGNRAFYTCTAMKSIDLPSGLASIGDYAFASCAALEEITIPGGVTAIGEEAFFNCTALQNIYVESGNQFFRAVDGILFNKAGNQLISYPRGRSGNAVVPENVDTLALGAFANCTALNKIILPDAVTQIPDYAFYGCSAVDTIVLGGGIQSVGMGAFYGCSGLKNIYFKGTEAEWNAITIGAHNELPENTTIHYNWSDAIYTQAPEKPYKIVNVVSGIHVYWDAVEGVEKYGLWRSETGREGSYEWIANPTTWHFTDIHVSSGKTYYYKVTVMSPLTGAHSAKSEAIGLTYVATPDITSRINKGAGIALGWNRIPGATGYAVYRKSYNGTDPWTRVATVAGNSTVSWVDTAVQNRNGTIYRYTIRALAGGDMATLSGCRSTGRTMVRLSSRTLNSAAAAGPGAIKCKWTTSAAVTGYEIRFMVDGQVFKTYTIGNYKTGVKTFTGLPAGVTYKVQVRAYQKVEGVGSFYSAWSVAKNVTI